MQVTDPPATTKDKNEDSEATEKPDVSTAGEKTKDSKATEKSESATGEPESGIGGTKKIGCQGVTNSFENFFLYWIIASLVNGGVKLRRMWRTYNIKPVIIVDVKSNATKHELYV